MEQEVTRSDFLSITPWVTILKANFFPSDIKRKRKKHFWVWVFALDLPACGYLEDFSDGNARSWVGSGEEEVWPRSADAPWRIPAAPGWQGDKAALARCWHLDRAIQSAQVFERSSRNNNSVSLELTDLGLHSILLPVGGVRCDQLQALCVHATGVWDENFGARAMAGEVILKEGRICSPKMCLWGIRIILGRLFLRNSRHRRSSEN